MRIFLLVLLALVLAGTASPAPGVVIQFRTPSGNIGCGYASGLGGPPSLRCDIRSGLKPKPARPRNCVDLEWGDSFEMGVRGRVAVTCHGDTAIDPASRILRYGKKWSRGGLSCVSRVVGLRCTNRSGHGFFLSRAHSFRF